MVDGFLFSSFLFLYFMVFCRRFYCDIRRRREKKCNATHGKNVWFHSPRCTINILQMKRYGLSHTWYREKNTWRVREREQRSLMYSCSYKLRWKFIVICDPRGRLLSMCIHYTCSEHTHTPHEICHHKLRGKHASSFSVYFLILDVSSIVFVSTPIGEEEMQSTHSQTEKEEEEENGRDWFECIAKMSKTLVQWRRWGCYDGLNFYLYVCLFVWHAVSTNIHIHTER